jgi:hypothetical protein
MMHIAAHCAHSVHGAMPLHMHIPPIGDVQYVQHSKRLLCRLFNAMVGQGRCIMAFRVPCCGEALGTARYSVTGRNETHQCSLGYGGHWSVGLLCTQKTNAGNRLNSRQKSFSRQIRDPICTESTIEKEDIPDDKK